MKKYIKYLGILLFMLPFCVKADVNVSVSCTNALIGETATCTVNASSSDIITAIEGNATITGGAASMIEAKAGNLDSIGSLNIADFTLLGGSSTSAKLFTVTFRGNVAGTTKLTVKITKYVKYVNDEYEDVPSSASGSGTVTITAPTTAPTTTTTTTTKPANNVTAVITPQPTTTTTANVQDETKHLELTSIAIAGYQITEEDGIYYVTVDPAQSTINVTATAPEGILITGTGEREISIGKNIVTITLNDGGGGVVNKSLIVIRPDGRDTNTLLESLTIINYDIKFEPENKTYVVSIPYDTKEVYVVAKSQNPDCIVNGDGLIKISGNETNAYIKVLYGDVASSTYVIKFKKSYKGLIPFIILSISLLGATIGIIVLTVKLKSKKQEKLNSQLAIEAQRNRLLKQSKPQIKIHGKTPFGLGPTVAEPAHFENKVVDTRPSNNPGMVPPKQEDLENIGVQPQVRVVNQQTDNIDNTQEMHDLIVNRDNQQ